MQSLCAVKHWVMSGNGQFTNGLAGVGGVIGFWFFLDFTISGPSARLPGAASFFPPIYTPMGIFENNVAHSNTQQGVAMYRNGYRPIDFAYLRWVCLGTP